MTHQMNPYTIYVIYPAFLRAMSFFDEINYLIKIEPKHVTVF